MRNKTVCNSNIQLPNNPTDHSSDTAMFHSLIVAAVPRLTSGWHTSDLDEPNNKQNTH